MRADGQGPDKLGLLLRGSGLAERGVPLASEESLQLVVTELRETLVALEQHVLFHHAANNLGEALLVEETLR
eukprot:CAMPEP_0196753350 /NCGR_PEP_ID=MMETSP1091-20130531/90444_1 /TAXON_ID=302021 /ORGANISM="Rhodomonas sp., Strain CCMP768" /LENGTH=71 /DNA_ID=CAMNT_0042101449 /DNA_START=263 /DNA_END=475 /DNA_ORIENTATION=+